MTPEVRLRPVMPDDIEVFFRHEQETEAQRRANFAARPHAEFVLHWTQRIVGDPEVGVRTVEVDGTVAGNVVSWWQDGEREVGYWLGSAFWGRGIGTRALRLYLEVETVRPLRATVDSGNLASIALLRRCGFEEGERVQLENGSYVVLRVR
ncbi:GNAT family N-acetyltransferase [Actinoplanes sp. LDG1-06]|uniref:GNAT family N-acetyltransferase n=1 Tax=Paractinoplanes ovalisporus TaxID=2810368 RepID=A0ABS2A9Y1_9ACTN|nr:GNAT family protein [Actinoplanes ovalisporus]MBM2616647.1 GNAT family N-acetyltransferase [Actinoplanes ovalisporus]